MLASQAQAADQLQANIDSLISYMTHDALAMDEQAELKVACDYLQAFLKKVKKDGFEQAVISWEKASFLLDEQQNFASLMAYIGNLCVVMRLKAYIFELKNYQQNAYYRYLLSKDDQANINYAYKLALQVLTSINTSGLIEHHSESVEILSSLLTATKIQTSVAELQNDIVHFWPEQRSALLEDINISRKVIALAKQQHFRGGLDAAAKQVLGVGPEVRSYTAIWSQIVIGNMQSKIEAFNTAIVDFPLSEQPQLQAIHAYLKTLLVAYEREHPDLFNLSANTEDSALLAEEIIAIPKTLLRLMVPGALPQLSSKVKNAYEQLALSQADGTFIPQPLHLDRTQTIALYGHIIAIMDAAPEHNNNNYVIRTLLKSKHVLESAQQAEQRLINAKNKLNAVIDNKMAVVMQKFDAIVLPILTKVTAKMSITEVIAQAELIQAHYQQNQVMRDLALQRFYAAVKSKFSKSNQKWHDLSCGIQALQDPELSNTIDLSVYDDRIKIDECKKKILAKLQTPKLKLLGKADYLMKSEEVIAQAKLLKAMLTDPNERQVALAKLFKEVRNEYSDWSLFAFRLKPTQQWYTLINKLQFLGEDELVNIAQGNNLTLELKNSSSAVISPSVSISTVACETPSLLSPVSDDSLSVHVGSPRVAARRVGEKTLRASVQAKVVADPKAPRSYFCGCFFGFKRAEIVKPAIVPLFEAVGQAIN